MKRNQQTLWIVLAVVALLIFTDMTVSTMIILGALFFIAQRIAPLVRRRIARYRRKRTSTQPLDRGAAAEIARLKAENARLTIERDILARALSGRS